MGSWAQWLKRQTLDADRNGFEFQFSNFIHLFFYSMVEQIFIKHICMKTLLNSLSTLG